MTNTMNSGPGDLTSEQLAHVKRTALAAAFITMAFISSLAYFSWDMGLGILVAAHPWFGWILVALWILCFLWLKGFLHTITLSAARTSKRDASSGHT
jgi:thiosulfate reductase cytochrome b subunit